MGKIESPLGNVEFNSSGGQRRLVIEDASGNPAEPPPLPGEDQVSRLGHKVSVEEAMEVRARKFAEAQQVEGGGADPLLKRRLEILLGIGRATTEVSIGEGKYQSVFMLRTLKSREQQHLVAVSQDADQKRMLSENYTIRDLTLVYSICAIDDIEIDVVLGIPENVSQGKRMALRQAYVGELDDVVLMHLFAEYTKLANKHSAKYVKTEDDVKEVAEQIKKSS